jgi:hypothetical protein
MKKNAMNTIFNAIMPVRQAAEVFDEGLKINETIY